MNKSNDVVVFIFDPLKIVVEAYEALYSTPCQVQFVEGLRSEEGAPWGCTEFEDGEYPLISIDVETPINGVIEVLAHELAHVAAGDSHDDDHGVEWRKCFDAIHDKYCELVLAL